MRGRNPFGAPVVASRRGGPVKAPLSRDLIVTEALRQITVHGLDRMSLRKVATALETGPASLYAYVEDLDELYALVLDRALHAVDVRAASGRGGWRERAMRLLASYAEVLAASSGLAKLAFGRVAIGPNALRITEALLALLAEGGVASASAAWGVDLLLLYVTAVVAEHSDGLNPAAPSGALVRAIAATSEAEHPHISAAREQLFSGTGEERFAWGVDTLLSGILQAPRPAPSTRKHKARVRS